MEQGWVYVLVNPTLPGLVKVGRTTRPPETRVAELSQATGVVTPFILIFEQVFADCETAERDIHAALDRRGLRFARNREFFRGPTTDILHLIFQYAIERGEDWRTPLAHSANDLVRQGDAHLSGQGDAVQYVPEALRCYQLAASRGSVLALERLGVIAAQSVGGTRTGRSRAQAYFQAGARRGNYYCQCELAAMAAEAGNLANFTKAWSLFFQQRRSARLDVVEEGPGRYQAALRRYVITCLALGVPPQHLDELRAEAAALMSAFEDLGDGTAMSLTEQRLRNAGRRWAREVLADSPAPRRYAPALARLLPRLSARWEDAAA